MCHSSVDGNVHENVHILLVSTSTVLIQAKIPQQLPNGKPLHYNLVAETLNPDDICDPLFLDRCSLFHFT